MVNLSIKGENPHICELQVSRHLCICALVCMGIFAHVHVFVSAFV